MVVGNSERDRQQQSGAYPRPALLKCFSVVPDKMGCGIGSQLLRKAESCCRGLGCSSTKIDVPMVRGELFEWFGRRGYRSTGGGTWLKDDVHFAKTTAYMTLEKDLCSPTKPTSLKV